MTERDQSTKQDFGEPIRDTDLIFDNLLISEELYRTNPAKARARILDSLELDKVVLGDRLIKLGVFTGIRIDLHDSSDKFATALIKKDRDVKDHPENEDNLFKDVEKIRDKHLSELGKLIDKATIHINVKENYDKRNGIGDTMRLYCKNVARRVAFESAEDKDLKDMMADRAGVLSDVAHFPNIIRSIKRAKPAAQPSTQI